MKASLVLACCSICACVCACAFYVFLTASLTLNVVQKIKKLKNLHLILLDKTERVSSDAETRNETGNKADYHHSVMTCIVHYLQQWTHPLLFSQAIISISISGLFLVYPLSALLPCFLLAAFIINVTLYNNSFKCTGTRLKASGN